VAGTEEAIRVWW